MPAPIVARVLCSLGLNLSLHRNAGQAKQALAFPRELLPWTNSPRSGDKIGMLAIITRRMPKVLITYSHIVSCGQTERIFIIAEWRLAQGPKTFPFSHLLGQNIYI